MKTPTKTKTRIHDNWLAGYGDKPTKKKKSSKKKSPKKKSSKIYVKLNSSPT